MDDGKLLEDAGHNDGAADAISAETRDWLGRLDALYRTDPYAALKMFLEDAPAIVAREGWS